MGESEPVISDLNTSWCEVFYGEKIREELVL